MLIKGVRLQRRGSAEITALFAAVRPRNGRRPGVWGGKNGVKRKAGERRAFPMIVLQGCREPFARKKQRSQPAIHALR